MRKKFVESRRNFLKSTAVGVAGLAVLGPGSKKASAAGITTKIVNLSTTQINQTVDNLRVAYITDATMVKSSTFPGFDGFNSTTNTAGVNYAAVKTNMDKLACGCANTTNVTTAWQALLKIPSTKTWATTKVAIKVNAFASMHPSVPIVARVVEVLTGFGVPAANICLFDGKASASGVYSGYVGAGKPMPAGITYGGSMADTVTFPDTTTMPACAAINGVDIIVNIAVNKGHDRFSQFSGVTMCLKNNFATICFDHQDGNPAQGIVRMAYANSCDYLVGNIPAAYPAKQQLCIVDSLWLGNPGDWGGTIVNGANANSIVMGTFAGAVDYVGTMKIRASKTGYNDPANVNQTIVGGFITQFGYAAAAKTTVMAPVTGAGQGLVDASLINITKAFEPKNSPASRQATVRFSISGSGFRPVSMDINLGQGEQVRSAAVYSMDGRLVATLSVDPGSAFISWDGKTRQGSIVRAGTYIVKIAGRQVTAAEQFIVRT
jgi:hypothetical protein